MRQTVDGLVAVALKTFDVGWAIRDAVEPIAAQLAFFLVVKVPASPSLSQFLRTLREQRDTFPERRLLESLLEAVTAEKAIDLSGANPAAGGGRTGGTPGRKPGPMKEKIRDRVRELKAQKVKWRNIYTTINKEFEADYTYSRAGVLQKLLNDG